MVVSTHAKCILLVFGFSSQLINIIAYFVFLSHTTSTATTAAKTTTTTTTATPSTTMVDLTTTTSYQCMDRVTPGLSCTHEICFTAFARDVCAMTCGLCP